MQALIEHLNALRLHYVVIREEPYPLFSLRHINAPLPLRHEVMAAKVGVETFIHQADFIPVPIHNLTDGIGAAVITYVQCEILARLRRNGVQGGGKES